EPAIVKQMDSAQPPLNRRAADIPGVLQAVHVTDFATVKCRNRQLGYPQLFENKLNNDLGIEVEIVGVSLERHLSKRLCRIDAIAGVKFRKLCAENLILESSEQLIANPFIHRHPAVSRRLFIDHSRPEDRV